MIVVFIFEDANLHFSGYETFPLRHGWLTKVAIEVRSQPDNTRGLFVDASAIVKFGVEKNIVTSMRHWASSSRDYQCAP